MKRHFEPVMFFLHRLISNEITYLYHVLSYCTVIWNGLFRQMRCSCIRYLPYNNFYIKTIHCILMDTPLVVAVYVLVFHDLFSNKWVGCGYIVQGLVEHRLLKQIAVSNQPSFCYGVSMAEEIKPVPLISAFQVRTPLITKSVSTAGSSRTCLMVAGSLYLLLGGLFLHYTHRRSYIAVIC